jgi:Domain of unknown function (DUF4157)
MLHRILRQVCVVAILSLIIAGQCSGSWLSDITGINIDIPGNRISFGPPRPDRIPMMLQNLPKDTAQFFLNPAGNALAFAIRQAKAQARQNCAPVPPQIVGTLSSFFPPDIFNAVCWNLVAQGISIDSLVIHDGGMAAITLEDVIVFRDSGVAADPVTWAHELTHVLQYRHLGLETFAFLYTFQFQSMENEAYAFQNFVASRLASNPNQQYWQTQAGWGSINQISSQQYVDAAKQFINPFTCSGIQMQPGVLVLTNNCPIAIRVTTVIMHRLPAGPDWQIACTNVPCFVQPGSVSYFPDVPGSVAVNALIIWRVGQPFPFRSSGWPSLALLFFARVGHSAPFSLLFS